MIRRLAALVVLLMLDAPRVSRPLTAPQPAPRTPMHLAALSSGSAGSCDEAEGELRCTDARLELVLAALTARYGVFFAAGDAHMANRLVTIDLPPMSMDTATAQLERELGAGVLRVERAVVLFSKVEPTQPSRELLVSH
jgi:hypothetical protein